MIDGMRIFLREAGIRGNPVLLLPHGYPSSSYEYRHLMQRLADRWYLLAPDYPGFGYSDTPENFDYSFGGYASFMTSFCKQLEIEKYAIYLHDYGAWIGLKLAMAMPERVSAFIIQNGDIYEDALGPKYAVLKEHWTNPSAATFKMFGEAVSEKGFRDEFVGEIDESLVPLIPPELWKLHWSMMTPRREEIMVGLMDKWKENLEWFPRYQAYLRSCNLPVLIIWGPQDGYMPIGSGEAYLRDVPNAEFHVLQGGHWLMETHIEEVTVLIRNFLARSIS
jgi:pimeloyl-ACP methyl ester carboxylesterase